MALVRLNNKYGFIDIKGNSTIDIMYDDADNFYEGLAVVELNSEWFYINKKGERVN